MAAVARTKWAKFPRFVEYANGRDRFQERTPANIEWAQNLSLLLLKRSGGKVAPLETAWHELGAHLPKFQQLLDAIIGSGDNPVLIMHEMMLMLTEHCGHVELESRWDRTLEEIREQEAEWDTMTAPAVREAIKARLAARWNVPGSDLQMDLPPRTPPRYHEMSTAICPLDGVYWDLREFFRRGQLERLRKCPVCQRFFVQVTRRAQTYCAPPVDLKPIPRAKSAVYRRRYQEQSIRRDLREVQTAKEQLWETGVLALELSWVLETADISSRRWTSLRQWEIAQYGETRVTDLTRRARPLARSG